ncbi:bifunctional phosphoribosylaminoimidazolecarboxamide formyltransferase/IMP cyclohydrolase [Flavobacteriaceae bacterium]|nr:bifunctional phosphoribosylaminoimidazolecarboxamide formyltransferase/IMP cyclohydrolase [Flavobacteriaceae bacterium]MDA9977825.1 bifunctional phosphoribosylaminoimidazolecarboxamide formyltransferase/IMP cyclohydrolase [Flavobacteriaceae bacterium]MDB4007515.1 bifunctional phosphoribosylaminoimidazolecarboxamide formyltransferase/IMP cyclohydrolase [Flavobacteriaceae bacterium]MDB4024148.1 bifunctional phosphoribosylaminoimidazolecarboxamide formyltransferase/IMP cyclohydrolase [Flavobacte
MLKLKSALISVFNKDGLEPIAKKLDKLGVKIYSTGGTELFLKKIGIPVIKVEDVTGYPSILGGRVKTLHPKIFGGILNRNDNNNDVTDLKNYEIPNIDLVIVDLYPFEETVKSNQSEENIIEKIDIGGISLIRAAAKNFKDVMCVSSKDDYSDFLNILNNDKGEINLKYRKNFAFRAFNVSSHYDTAIFNYFKEDNESLKASYKNGKELRYGENPHQKGMFYGDFNSMFEQLHGKELSYNNLLDVDAAVNLILEFYNDMPTFAILKHNNACGLASRNSLLNAYKDALAGDPVSAFGGVLISNKSIDVETAEEINKLFCEVVIAPGFEESAIKLLKSKKNRILLVLKNTDLNDQQLRTCLNGVLTQDKDSLTDSATDFKTCTEKSPNKSEIKDLEFASKICKHTKSNTIVLAKNLQLISSGTGQTSRVDALKQAIEKSNNFKFDLNNSVMASDAFFPFPDCVEIAHKSGISSVIQPGGSIKDDLSIEYCNKNNISMVLTGTRHFKH